MRKENLAVRLIFMLIGTFIMAFGVAISIRSTLGTTPISSVPYVYNFIFPRISIGQLSILLNTLFIIIQALILKKKFKSYHLLQIPLVILFGLFIDFHLFLTENLIPLNYLIKLVLCVFSCFIIAFGIFLQVKANVSFLPGEGLIMAISETFKKEFGYTKIIFDSALVAISILSILFFLKEFVGVREGTILAAILVGFIVQFYQKNIVFVDKLVEPSGAVKEFVPEPYMNTENFVITISREYGSGGHAVGELIAQKLGIAFYDSSLIDLTAEASGFTSEYVKKHEQKLSNKFLYQFYKQNYAFVNEVMPPQDLIFLVQTKVIRDIASKESCVIVGRSANYILKGHPNCFNVFVHANEAFRLSRVITDYGADPEDAQKEMEKKDKERMNYSKHYTGRNWDDLKDYDLTIESSLFGIDITAAMIIDARRKALYAGT